MTLLVCDDAPDVRALVKAMLADQAAIEVVGEAENGEQAIERVADLAPDVVLMDVEMPVLGGVEATRRLRALGSKTRVVAFAGSGDSEVVMAMIAAGATAYCTKSADAQELERAIVAAGDPLVRLAQAVAEAPSAEAILELAAGELRSLTDARAVTAYFCEASTDEPPEAARRAHAESSFVRDGDSLAIPLLSNEQTLAVLLVSGAAEASDLSLVSAIATVAGAALAGERRRRESELEARRDALTGVGNRRAFDERMAAAFEAGGASAVSLVLLDLDDFKDINDTRGHAAGDRVLSQVAVALLREARASEEVFRIGGDEFAVVVEGDSAAAFRVAARMRSALVRQRRGEPMPTLSAGVAGAPADAKTSDGLLRTADAALYAAKWSGRNRVVAYSGDERGRQQVPVTGAPQRILVVDDDAGLRALLRATFAGEVEVQEARDAREAAAAIARARPDVIVLDVEMPGIDGLTFCRSLKHDPATSDIRVVLLTGLGSGASEEAARRAGADAYVRKPFSPLELVGAVERVAGGQGSPRPRPRPGTRREEQLLLYAEDMREMLELERAQRALLQRSYRDTVTALATALESKDAGTGAHSERVQRYAVELARAVDPQLLEDESLEYGFLLHDIGKIGVPDSILLKPGPLTIPERRLMQLHTVLGEQMLGDVTLLQGEGLRVVRSHHERWDGRGYPDGLAATKIPLGARVFAVADTLDAITSERPYRTAASWEAAVAEITRGAATQFDPGVVRALRARDPQLRLIARELEAAWRSPDSIGAGSA